MTPLFSPSRNIRPPPPLCAHGLLPFAYRLDGASGFAGLIPPFFIHDIQEGQAVHVAPDVLTEKVHGSLR